jgi:hypothetical protein
MAGLVPTIHVFPATTVVKPWMPGTSLGMTSFSMAPDPKGSILLGGLLGNHAALSSSSESKTPRLP